ncbi:trichohyalin-like protein [Heterostelium album PN500]|uniref:Trichohyalin-like protein n=1 Tax=Heterostelium pallidum (strain ATCC 26659 / Pp 5 / PN500) TaxID=670386 RepID=D3AXT0_HETP5|nr:trichohyalin-like protein [Heterostelium album PN500]EFA85757.1 trichohyalin-like protein [Heterostelium album PN500]|eukprot:XP_020437863.1 trichohyalin-like protein [Heterostelium album PN500]
MDNNNNNNRVIDKPKIVEEVAIMFPLFTKDHFLYATLDRYNWDVNAALDTLQKRHDALEKEQKHIEAVLEAKKQQNEKKDKAFKEVKDIFGESFTDAKYYSALAKYKMVVEDTVNYLMHELSIVEEVKRRKDVETRKREEREKEKAKQIEVERLRIEEEKNRAEIKRQEDEIQARILQLEKLKLAEQERARKEEERRLAEEEAKRVAEERARKEAEERRLAEERARKEAEERRLAEERERLRIERIKREEEEEERRLAEERERLRKMVEEQEKRIQEMLAQKKLDEEKHKQYQDRINSILLELKNQPTEYKKEIASSEIFQDLLKDFQSVLKLSEEEKMSQVKPPLVPIPSTLPVSYKPELVAPFGFTATNAAPSQVNEQDIHKPSSPFQNLTKHPFYYNPFSDPISQQLNGEEPFVPTTPPSSPPPSYPFTANFPVVYPLSGQNSPPFARYNQPQQGQDCSNTGKPTFENLASFVASSQCQPLVVSQVMPTEADMIAQPKLSSQPTISPARAKKNEALENLRSMFSATSPEIVGYVWEASNYDISVAIQNLLDINSQK